MSDSTAHIMFESSTVSVSSIHVFVCCTKSLQSCPTLCDPMDCSLPDSSVHEILQARRLEWVVIPFSRGSSQPRDQTHVSYMSLALAGEFFTTSATWEAPCMCICPKEEERVFTELKHQWPQKHSLGFLYRGQHNTEKFPHHKHTSLTLS